MGPPTCSATQKFLSQSGSEIMRLKLPPRTRPYLPLRIVRSAQAYSGKNGSTWPTINRRRAFLAAVCIRRQSATLSAIGFSENTCLPRARARTAISACSAGGKRDVDQVDRVVGEHLPQVRVRGHAGEIHLRAARPKVALDVAPVAGKPLPVLFTQRDDLHAAKFLIGEVMHHPHEADAGDADANHPRTPQ